MPATVTIQDIKKRGGKAISDDEITMIIINSKPKGYILPPAVYEEIMEYLEDMEDALEVQKRLNEPYISEEEFWKSIDA